MVAPEAFDSMAHILAKGSVALDAGKSAARTSHRMLTQQIPFNYVTTTILHVVYPKLWSLKLATSSDSSHIRALPGYIM